MSEDFPEPGTPADRPDRNGQADQIQQDDQTQQDDQAWIEEMAEVDLHLPDPDVVIDLTSTHESDPESGSAAENEEADMSATTLDRPPVSTAARILLSRSRTGLLQACAARSCGERYVAAHLSALRAAAAVLAVRGRPVSRSGPRSVWEVLPRIAPELGEWSAFFAATASRRAAVEAGRGDVITARDANDLLRDAESFHNAVEALLGLPHQPVLPLALPSCT